MRIFKKLTNIETKKPLISLFGILMFGIALIPKNYAIADMFETKIYPYLVLAIPILLGLSILILATISKKKKEKYSIE